MRLLRLGVDAEVERGRWGRREEGCECVAERECMGEGVREWGREVCVGEVWWE